MTFANAGRERGKGIRLMEQKVRKTCAMRKIQRERETRRARADLQEEGPLAQ